MRAHLTADDSNRIRKHEFTRPDKEDDRVRQIEALNAQTERLAGGGRLKDLGPVLAFQSLVDATVSTRPSLRISRTFRGLEPDAGTGPELS